MSVPRRAEEKILTRAEVLARLGRPRNHRLVFTNGVFDLLHRGHVDYLQRARALGDALVVAVNTDASVRRLEKGADRPLNGEADRALLLAALECVDWVCLFDDDTPQPLLAELLPDVLVKGGDYAPEDVAGRVDVMAAGGRVEIIPFTAGYSTSGLLRRVRDTAPEPPAP